MTVVTGSETEQQLEIVTVDRLPLGGEKAVLQVRGRWTGLQRPEGDAPRLIVAAGGTRHEFPAIPQPRRPRLGRPEAWSASFAVPVDALEAPEVAVAVIVGELEVPIASALLEEDVELPAPIGEVAPDPAALEPRLGPPEPELLVSEPTLDPPEVVESPLEPELVAPEPELVAPEPELVAPEPELVAPEPELVAPEHEPLAALAAEIQAREAVDGPAPPEPDELNGDDPAFDETLGRLRSELRERAAREATLRGRLADLQAEAQARATTQQVLEGALGDIRRELDQLADAVRESEARRAETESRALALAAEVARLEQALAEAGAAHEALVAEHAAELRRLRAVIGASEAARDSAVSEAAGLGAELDRLTGELADARSRLKASGAGLSEARALLGQARELRSQMESTTEGEAGRGTG